MRTGGFGREHPLACTFVRNQNRAHAFGGEELAASRAIASNLSI